MDNDMLHEERLVDEVSRPFKRRKFYRKRVNYSDDEEAGSAEPSSSNKIPYIPTTKSPQVPSASQSDDDGMTHDGVQLPVSEILRRRRLAQKRRAGIEFSNATPVPEGGNVEVRPGDEVLDNEDSFGKILTVVDRFAPQTGQVADVDKHMYALPKLCHARLKMQMLTM
ncbi:MAG: hypothetical protein Q9225_003598 [Loekoesia sp. 1 TL-2023]